MNRPTVLLVPGMTLNATIFGELPWHSIAPDFNGWVVSPDGTPPPGPPPMDRYADALDDLVAAQPDWRAGPRIAVGHSFGGMLLLWWWLRHEGTGVADLHGLVLVSTTAGPLFDILTLRLPVIGRRVPLRRFIRWWNRPGVTRTVKRITSRGRETGTPVDFQQLRRRNDVAADLAGWRNTDWRAMRTFRYAMDGFDLRPRLKDIRVPTIVLHGGRDTFFRPEVGRALAEGLPSAEFELVAGAGHALPLAEPAAVRDAVARLLPA